MKNHEEKNFISGESDDESASVVLKFIFSDRVQFGTLLYRIVENSTDYPNLSLLFEKC